MVRKAARQLLCSRIEDSTPHGVEPSTEVLEEQATGRSKGAEDGLISGMISSCR